MTRIYYSIQQKARTLKTNQRFHPLLIGNGTLTGTLEHDDDLQLSIHPGDNQQYHDAQISDYMGLQRSAFPWRPPLQLFVRARVSHPTEQLCGTMGFGFWNHPFMPGEAYVRLPRAVWFFFGSPPNAMELARGVPGHGWKAATFDASRWPFLGLAPFAPLGFLLMRVPLLYRLLWPVGQWSIGVSERLLTHDLTHWHDYELHWRLNHVQFWVDGELVHVAPTSPRAPLGFIAWIDNQYAIVTPQGRLGFGYVAVPEPQTLHVASVQITPG